MLRRLAPTLANNIWKMHAIRLLYWMHFFASVLVPMFRDWGHISYTQIFFLNAWFMFWNFLLEVPTGTVADVFGRKISIVCSALVAVVGFRVYVSRPDFRVFLIGEILIAASMTLMSGADEALVYDSLEQLELGHTSKRIFARLESFKLAGIVTGALCGGAIAKRFGLSAPLLAQAIPAALAALVALTLVEPQRVAAGTGWRGYARLLRSGIVHFRGHPILRVLAVDMVGSAAIAWLIIWLYQPQLERVGIDIAFFGFVHAGMCVGQILLLHNIERVEALFGSRTRYLLVSAIVPGVCYLVIGISNHTVVVTLAVLIAATFGLSRPPLFASYMNKYIPSEQRATVLSVVSMLRTLVIAVINPIAGWLVDWSMRPALLIFGITALIVATLTRVQEEHLVD